MADPIKKLEPLNPPPPAFKSIWIINNTSAGMGLAFKPVRQPGSNTLSAPDFINIVPGANIIDLVKWEKWKSEQEGCIEGNEATRLLTTPIPTDPHRNRRQERAGQPYLVEGPKVKDPRFPVSDIGEAQAVAIIPEILDELLLKFIKATEPTKAVIEVVNRELTKIEKGLRPPQSA